MSEKMKKMFLNQMSTDESPADLNKVISMLSRKLKRRTDRRAVAALVHELQRAIQNLSLELKRVRRNYKSLEMALIHQHTRDTMEIEYLKQKLSEPNN